MLPPIPHKRIMRAGIFPPFILVALHAAAILFAWRRHGDMLCGEAEFLQQIL